MTKDKSGRHGRGDAGDVVGTVVVAPVLLLVVAAVIQMGVVGYTRHVAAVSADAGVSIVAASDGSVADGVERVNVGMSKGGNWISSSTVNGTRTGSVATVQVTAQPLKILPFGIGPVTVERTRPTERPT